MQHIFTFHFERRVTYECSGFDCRLQSRFQHPETKTREMPSRTERIRAATEKREKQPSRRASRGNGSCPQQWCWIQNPAACAMYSQSHLSKCVKSSAWIVKVLIKDIQSPQMEINRDWASGFSRCAVRNDLEQPETVTELMEKRWHWWRRRHPIALILFHMPQLQTQVKGVHYIFKKHF